MLARSGADAPTRLGRAKAAAIKLRSALPEIPVGVASLTDRTLPHLFPSADADVFRATVGLALDIEKPPPRSSFITNATSFDSLATVATQRFFSPPAARRAVVVLTDGETLGIKSRRAWHASAAAHRELTSSSSSSGRGTSACSTAGCPSPSTGRTPQREPTSTGWRTRPEPRCSMRASSTM